MTTNTGIAHDHVKIYLAARFWAGCRADTRKTSNPHFVASSSESYPYHLESFHYIGNGSFDEAIRYMQYPIFLDSGAFSMFTKGAEVDLNSYGDFIRDRADYLEVASNVDAIGAGKEALSYANQKELEKMKLPVKVCPVHHARDDDKWLVKYLDEGYDYLFLGGMVPETTKYLYGWLDHIWDKYLALPNGEARIKVHGFGLTTLELMERYPWYSLDSTNWLQWGSYGGILWDDDLIVKARLLKISRTHGSYKVAGQNFWSLDAVSRERVEKIIRSRGFDPEDLANSYGWRDKWNIQFYKRFMERLKPVFQRRQVTFF